VLLGIVAASVAVLVTGIRRSSVDVAYAAMFIPGLAALLYGLWPELRHGVRDRR